VNWLVPYRAWIGQGLNPYEAQTVWNGRFLSIPAQIAGLFDIGKWNLGWMRVYQQGMSISLLVPVLGFVFLVLLALQLQRFLENKTISFRTMTLLGLLAAMSCMTPFFPGLWVSKADPYWCTCDAAYQQTLEYVQSKIKVGDVLVFDSYGTDHWHCWLNDWREPQPWYSLRYEIAGPSSVKDDVQVSDLTADLFTTLGQQYSRLWYVNSSQTPDYSVSEENEWLGEKYHRESINTFSDSSGEIQVGLFSLE
jgi:hypothetical protein